MSKVINNLTNEAYILNSMQDLVEYAGTAKRVYILGYHSEGDGGGGYFYWDANEDKANHNGGTIIDPNIAFPTDWSNTTQQSTWFTAGTGSGCWKRIYSDAVNVKWFGAVCDGVTDDTEVIQNTINKNKNIYIPEGYINIKKGNIKIPDNTNINCDGIIITNAITSEMPLFFFIFSGNDIKVKLNAEFNINNFDSTSLGRMYGFDTDQTEYNNIQIINGKYKYPFYFLQTSQNITIKNMSIKNNEITSINKDIFIENAKFINLNIKNNIFNEEKNWTTPVGFVSSILIKSGFSTTFDDNIYTNNCSYNINIENNYIYKPNGRPIRIHNTENITIKNNKIDGVAGHYDTVGVSGDVITIDLCRHFEINNNIIMYGGENGIDLLACHDGIVSNNIVHEVRAMAIDVSISDAEYDVDFTLSNNFRVSSNININNNQLIGGVSGLTFRVCRNIQFNNNEFGYFENAAGVTNHYHIVINTAIDPKNTGTYLADTDDVFKILNITGGDGNYKREGNVPTRCYFGEKDHIFWGTITLGRNLALESEWLLKNSNSISEYPGFTGFFPNEEIYYQLDSTIDYNQSTIAIRNPSEIKINGILTTTENAVVVKKGCIVQYKDADVYIIITGDYIVDRLPTTSRGTNLDNVTSGYIKIKTW